MIKEIKNDFARTRSNNEYYDVVRGFAMLLVVLDHSIQSAMPDSFDTILLFRMIYSFHMPLFMFLSGVVSYKPERKMDSYWLLKKIKVLVVPFIAWLIIPFIFHGDWKDFGVYLINVYNSIDNARAWFLWLLFLCCLSLYASSKVAHFCAVEESRREAYY